MLENVNKNLLKNFRYLLNKNDITYEDLKEIKVITFNPVSIDNQYEDIDLDILEYLTNLETVEFINLFIKNKDIKLLDKIKSLKDVTFENCEFEEELLIKILNVKSLSFINSDIRDLEFVYNMNHLERLSIIHDNVNVKEINKLSNLKYLDLSNSLMDDNEIIYIKNLEHLYINNTNFSDLNFLLNLKSLKTLSIDENQFNNSKLVINKLIDNGVLVYDECFVQYKGCELNERDN